MMRVEFDYDVFAMLRMSGEDLKALQAYSQDHYDGRCKAASSLGGFLYGFTNQWMFAAVCLYKQFADFTPVELKREEVFRVSTHQLDTLAKICENNDLIRFQFFVQTHNDCTIEYRRLCPHPHTIAEDQLEQELERLMTACSHNSGMSCYPELDRQRKDILRQIEGKRALTRWEFINLHGYQQWLTWTKTNGLPESHPTTEISNEQTEI